MFTIENLRTYAETLSPLCTNQNKFVGARAEIAQSTSIAHIYGDSDSEAVTEKNNYHSASMSKRIFCVLGDCDCSGPDSP